MSDHVSFFKAQALPGQRDSVVQHFAKWEQEQKPMATGFISSEICCSNDDPDLLMGEVHFDNTDNYFANANRPEQDAWYRQLRTLLATDPEWFDGTLLRQAMM